MPLANSLNPLPAFKADCPIDLITPETEFKIPLTVSPNDVITPLIPSNTEVITGPNAETASATP